MIILTIGHGRSLIFQLKITIELQLQNYNCEYLECNNPGASKEDWTKCIKNRREIISSLWNKGNFT